MTLPSKYDSPNSRLNRNGRKIFLIVIGGIITTVLYFWISAILEDPELHWRIISSLWVAIIPGVAVGLLRHLAWRRFGRSKYHLYSFWPK